MADIVALTWPDDANHVLHLCLRIAVLDANPRGRAFWTQLGFAREKTTYDGDGQMRHVHRLPINKDMS